MANHPDVPHINLDAQIVSKDGFASTRTTHPQVSGPSSTSSTASDVHIKNLSFPIAVAHCILIAPSSSSPTAIVLGILTNREGGSASLGSSVGGHSIRLIDIPDSSPAQATTSPAGQSHTGPNPLKPRSSPSDVSEEPVISVQNIGRVGSLSVRSHTSSQVSSSSTATKTRPLSYWIRATDILPKSATFLIRCPSCRLTNRAVALGNDDKTARRVNDNPLFDGVVDPFRQSSCVRQR
ncbi:hypothetical protein IW262DRAFT_1115002 [Armillaria fumosa]|nr:hypothetical protein IW262DRAFT_1115002 [Armillaria fumosa]